MYIVKQGRRGGHNILEAPLEHYRAPPETDNLTSHSVRVF